jgi:hypothetical protein
MVDKARESIAESAILPKKQIITEERLLEVWETRGLKFRIDEFHQHCVDRGLMPHFKVDNFRAKVYRLLKQFLVEGETRRDPRFVPPPKKRKVV